jgi:hypothetical protein
MPQVGQRRTFADFFLAGIGWVPASGQVSITMVKGGAGDATRGLLEFLWRHFRSARRHHGLIMPIMERNRNKLVKGDGAVQLNPMFVRKPAT